MDLLSTVAVALSLQPQAATPSMRSGQPPFAAIREWAAN
jgi:hypothetical protein